MSSDFVIHETNLDLLGTCERKYYTAAILPGINADQVGAGRELGPSVRLP